MCWRGSRGTGILVTVADRPDDLRAADSDREYVAERLRGALAEGRIDLAEFDERLGSAYAARTYGELKALLTDLPATVPAERSAVAPYAANPPVPVDYSGATAKWLANHWSGWVTTTLILVAIWAISGAGYFWPVWPSGIWGAVLLAQTISGLASGAPRRQVEREARKRAERERRRIEKRLEGGTGSNSDSGG
jgi:hypothetical protein